MTDKSFSNFLNKVQEGNIIELESSEDYQQDISYKMIFEISQYIQFLPSNTIETIKNDLIKHQSFSKPNNFSINFINKLISIFSENGLTTSDINKKIQQYKLVQEFNIHLHNMRNAKHAINLKIVGIPEDRHEDIHDAKLELQEYIENSNYLFSFWYFLHQHDKNKYIKNYNFFNTHKSSSSLKDIHEGFRIHNFDKVPATEHIPSYFVASMIVNQDVLEYEEMLEPEFNLVGIFVENKEIACYRYLLTDSNPNSARNFFDAIHMLIS